MAAEPRDAIDYVQRVWFEIREDGRPDDIDELLEATGIPLAPGIDANTFGNVLNSFVMYSVSNQISGLRSKPDAERVAVLAKGIVEYIELSERLNRDGDTLPTIPSDKRRHFYSLMDEFKSVGDSKMRKSPTKWLGKFYLEGLGIFAAAFHKTPKSTYNETTGISINEAVLFFEHILTHVGLEQHRLGFDERFGYERKANSLCWDHKANKHTIRERIAKSLKVMPDTAVGNPYPEGVLESISKAGQPRWQGYRDFYQKIYFHKHLDD